MIPMGEFVAIKMDMRSSRRIGDRERVQEQFLQVMESLNREFAPSIQARFIVTHGDEAQGMLKREFSPNVLAVMERAMEGVYPVELRFGIGMAHSASRNPIMEWTARPGRGQPSSRLAGRRKHVMFSDEQTERRSRSGQSAAISERVVERRAIGWCEDDAVPLPRGPRSRNLHQRLAAAGPL